MPQYATEDFKLADDVAEQVEHTLVNEDDLGAILSSRSVSAEAVTTETISSNCTIDRCSGDDLGDVGAWDRLAAASIKGGHKGDY